MDAESARTFLLTLPHVVETRQWGDNLVFWVGDKAIGGKMFALINLDATGAVISYSAGRERFAELVEQDGFRPAPYFARIHWIAADRWSAHRNAGWQADLRAAHALTLAKMPKRTQALLALPTTARNKLIRERQQQLADRPANQPSKSVMPKRQPAAE